MGASLYLVFRSRVRCLFSLIYASTSPHARRHWLHLQRVKEQRNLGSNRLPGLVDGPYLLHIRRCYLTTLYLNSNTPPSLFSSPIHGWLAYEGSLYLYSDREGRGCADLAPSLSCRGSHRIRGGTTQRHSTPHVRSPSTAPLGRQRTSINY
jgi:hypothetical protein